VNVKNCIPPARVPYDATRVTPPQRFNPSDLRALIGQKAEQAYRDQREEE
jgi:hypothetical protein